MFARGFGRFSAVCSPVARAYMVMRKNAAAAAVPSPHKPEQQPQAPRKKLSFREPEVVPRGKPRVVLDRADEFELDDELQVPTETIYIIVVIIARQTRLNSKSERLGSGEVSAPAPANHITRHPHANATINLFRFCTF